MRERTILFLSILFLFFIFSFFFGKEIKFSLVLLFGMFIILISLINIDFAIVCLILSMLLSPEIIIGRVPVREVTVRFDDIMIIIVFISWLVRQAVYKELPVFKSTPLNKSIGLYLGVAFFCTALGVMRGNVNIKNAFFYLLKYSEYFLIYFMIVNVLKEKRQVNLYITFIIITCAITTIYGLTRLPTGERLTAPFETEAEPNTFGGYLVLITPLIIGILIYYNLPNWLKFSLIGLVLLNIIAIGYSLSRASYMALPFMYLALLLFSERKIGLLLGALSLIVVFILWRPYPILERIKGTFETEPGAEFQEEIFGIPLGASPSARIASWRDALNTLYTKYPIFGTGVTGWRFLDGQYIRTLVELGIVGFFFFSFLLWETGKNLRKICRETENIYKGIALGVLAGYIGILFHAVTANSFILIRIQEPLWFLIGIVINLPEISKE